MGGLTHLYAGRALLEMFQLAQNRQLAVQSLGYVRDAVAEQPNNVQAHLLRTFAAFELAAVSGDAAGSAALLEEAADSTARALALVTDGISSRPLALYLDPAFGDQVQLQALETMQRLAVYPAWAKTLAVQCEPAHVRACLDAAARPPRLVMLAAIFIANCAATPKVRPLLLPLSATAAGLLTSRDAVTLNATGRFIANLLDDPALHRELFAAVPRLREMLLAADQGSHMVEAALLRCPMVEAPAQPKASPGPSSDRNNSAAVAAVAAAAVVVAATLAALVWWRSNKAE